MSEDAPDYRTNNMDYTFYFTSDDALELESNFGFRENFFLESKLNTIFRDFDLFTNHVNLRRANNDINILKIVDIRAKKLYEILKKTSLEQRLLIQNSNQSIDNGSIHSIIEYLENLSFAANRAANELPKTKPGDKPNCDKELVVGLYQLYTRGTGLEDKYTYHGDTNSYESLFFDFYDRCVEIAKVENLSLTPAAIAAIIKSPKET